MSKPQEGV